MVIIGDLTIHASIKKPLDTLIYNVDNDFDFIIIITGNGLTRVGKTTLAQQIGYYYSQQRGIPFSVDNIVFGGKELIKIADKLPKGSVIIDDESREDLSSKSQMDTQNKELMTFFNECGMYNHLIILVATDFFDFNKGIAITRSELLINCVRSGIQTKDKFGNDVIKLGRGDYDIYDRKGKQILYMNGKKNYNEYTSKYSISSGTFNSHWLIDKAEYEKRKLIFLKRDREKKREVRRFEIAVKNMHDVEKMTFGEIGGHLLISEPEVRYYYNNRSKCKIDTCE